MLWSGLGNRMPLPRALHHALLSIHTADPSRLGSVSGTWNVSGELDSHSCRLQAEAGVIASV